MTRHDWLVVSLCATSLAWLALTLHSIKRLPFYAGRASVLVPGRFFCWHRYDVVQHNQLGDVTTYRRIRCRHTRCGRVVEYRRHRP